MSLKHQTSLSMYSGSSLHIAARNRDIDKLEELLQDQPNLDQWDNDGNTPLHTLLSDVCCDECKSKAAICVELLLDAGAEIDLPNKLGDVPLFLAVKNEWEECVKVLLVRGADATLMLEGGKTLALYVTQKIPDAFNDVLDHAVRRDKDDNNRDVLRVDFSALLQYPKRMMNASLPPEENNDETQFIHSLLGISKRTSIFDHPVTELFMLVKYNKLRNVIYISLLLHMLTLAFYTTFIVFLYIYWCPYDEDRKNCTQSVQQNWLSLLENGTDPETERDKCEPCESNNWITYMSIVLAVIWLANVGSEIISLRHRFHALSKTDILSKSVVGWLIFYILMPISLYPTIEEEYYINTWRYPIAAAGVWLIWALCIEHFNRIPVLSVYLVMFTKVAFRIIKLACMFFPLLVGFTVGFFVMGAPNVKKPYSFLTLISSMIGASGYEDFFPEENHRREAKSIVYTIVAYALYFLFITLMSVVFINFLLGLTISNVQEVLEDARLTSKKNQISLMYLFDRLKFIRYYIFKEQNNLEYTVPVKRLPTDPTFIPRTLVRRLKALVKKEDCQHQNFEDTKSIQLGSSSPTPPKGRSNRLRRDNSKDNNNFQLLDAIRDLESQISALHKKVQANYSSSNI